MNSPRETRPRAGANRPPQRGLRPRKEKVRSCRLRMPPAITGPTPRAPHSPSCSSKAALRQPGSAHENRDCEKLSTSPRPILQTRLPYISLIQNPEGWVDRCCLTFASSLPLRLEGVTPDLLSSLHPPPPSGSTTCSLFRCHWPCGKAGT